MDMKQLEAFEASARLKSFSKAAAALYLTQPTISSHIKALETELDCALFVRSHRCVVLTEAGTRLYPYVRRILDLKAEALARMKSPVSTTVSIGASTIPSAYLLPDLLREFRQSHPDIFFSIRQSDSEGIENMVLDGVVDFGLTGREFSDSRCQCQPLWSDRLVLAMPSSAHYRKLSETFDTIELLRTQPVILREQGSGTRKAMDAFLEDLGIDQTQINIAARNNDPESIKRMVAGGMGISILSDMSTRDMEKTGQIIIRPLDTGKPRKFYLIRQKEKSCSSAALSIMQFILSQVNKGSADRAK